MSRGRKQRVLSFSLTDVGISFGDGPRATPVLDDITLSIQPGEVLAIRGVNGTGKTTLLNLLAGLYAPSWGKFEYEYVGKRRGIGFVQQDYTSSLLPWLSAIENIALPLRLRGVKARERRERARCLLTHLSFSGFPVDAFPHQLSGGQKQRVAIARALLSDPAALFLDEPFANLDARTVRSLEEALLATHGETGITVVLISHDLESALYLADRVVILNGQPGRLYREVGVNIPRPRHRSHLLSSAFLDTRAEVLRAEEFI